MLTLEALEVVLSTQDNWVRAVDALSLTIQRGETFALVGESGCGKSMTALALMRLLPDNGRIVQGDLCLQVPNAAAQYPFALPESAMTTIRGRRIAMIFQEPGTSLNPVMPIGHQIGEVLRQHTRLTGRQVRNTVIEWLERVGIPKPEQRFNDYPFQFSGGQKQRIMIALALAAKPEVLIADEPTTALDVTLQRQIMELLSNLQAELGMSMLLITHDLALMSRYAQHVALMYAGQLVELADVPSFIQHPAHPYAQQLIAALPNRLRRGQPLAAIAGTVPRLDQIFSGCRFAPRCEQAIALCSQQPPELVSSSHQGLVRCLRWSQPQAFEKDLVLMRHDHSQEDNSQRVVTLNTPDAEVSRPAAITASFKPSTRPTLLAKSLLTSEPVLTLDNLKVSFPVRGGLLRRTRDWVKVVDGVSLNLYPGKTLALVGESGCGKTTLARAVLQLLDSQACVEGKVTLLGHSLMRLQGQALRQARRNIQIVFQDPFASLNPRLRIDELLAEGMRSLYPQVPAVQVQARAAALLERVGLDRQAFYRYPHEFSGGQRQRIAIARALMVEPCVIIFDEPTSALDVSVQAQILNLLRELQQETGMTYLLVTHNFAVVDYCADEVAVMHAGRIIEQGSAHEVLEQPQQAYTKTLLAAVPTLADFEC